MEIFVFKLSLEDLLRIFLSRESLWLRVIFVFCRCLDQFSFLSSDKPRYLTMSEEGNCLLFKDIGGDRPCLSVNTVWVDFDSLIFTRQREYQGDSRFR